MTFIHWPFVVLKLFYLYVRVYTYLYYIRTLLLLRSLPTIISLMYCTHVPVMWRDSKSDLIHKWRTKTWRKRAFVKMKLVPARVCVYCLVQHPTRMKKKVVSGPKLPSHPLFMRTPRDRARLQDPPAPSWPTWGPCHCRTLPAPCFYLHFILYLVILFYIIKYGWILGILFSQRGEIVSGESGNRYSFP